jgi:Zn-dependent protease with chaperone function
MNEDKASRYHRLKRQAQVASLAWGVALLVGLLVTGLTLRLRAVANLAAPGSPESVPAHVAGTIVFVILLSLLNEVGSLPLAFYSGFLLERRYGLSTEGLPAWFRDQAKSFALGLALSAPAAVALYLVMAWSPERWWLVAGLVFAAAIVGLTNIAPVFVLPMFYRLKPLERATLRDKLLVLAERAGARVVGAYEWGLAAKTRKANAALAGLGATRRILVSDTMLAEYTEDEIEVVLAHELAHHVHGDIWKGIAFESALILGGFYLASRLLRALAGPLGFHGVADIAGLPLLLLAAGAVSLVMLPVAHAMSRAFERRADRFALRLTRNPAAFISAMKRLGAQNLAEENPSALVQWLFYTHPPVRERIAAAQAFAGGKQDSAA